MMQKFVPCQIHACKAFCTICKIPKKFSKRNYPNLKFFQMMQMGFARFFTVIPGSLVGACAGVKWKSTFFSWNPPFFFWNPPFFSEIHLCFLKSTFFFWKSPFWSNEVFCVFFGSIDHESTQNELLERIEQQIHTELPSPRSRCVPGRASHLRARSRKWMTHWSDCFHSKVIF